MKRTVSVMNNINFDQMHVSGNMGDMIEVGKVLIDGASGDGLVAGRDDGSNQVWRVGDLEA